MPILFITLNIYLSEIKYYMILYYIKKDNSQTVKKNVFRYSINRKQKKVTLEIILLRILMTVSYLNIKSYLL